MNVPSFRKGVALDTFFYAYTPGWLEMLANPWAILFILVFVLGTTCFVWGGRQGARWGSRVRSRFTLALSTHHHWFLGGL